MDILAEITDGTVDDIEQAIMALMGLDRIDTEAQVRKFRTLKIAVLWLQNEQKFGRYCYYGCYCLPEGSHNIAAGGYGIPLDDIDRSCFEFKQCYKCLLAEHAGDHKGIGEEGICAGEEHSYKMDLFKDINGEKHIECTNKLGSCRRNICECDKALSEKLARYEETWDESYHTNKGGFVREDFCHKKNGPGNPSSLTAGSCPCETCPCPEQCCGDKTTFPFNQPKSANNCCDGSEAKAAGTC